MLHSDVTTDAGLTAELRYAVMQLRRRLVFEQHPDNPLSIAQMTVLGTLMRHGDMTIGALAAHEKVQPPSMTRTVKCLAEDGYVTRTPHETDGRIVVVGLADEGRSILAADRDRRDAWLTRQLEELDEDERELLRRATPLLQRLAQVDSATAGRHRQKD